MNGQSTVNHSANSNEQLIGKFQVVNVDMAQANHDEPASGTAQQPLLVPSTADESACASRFQMIRVDRNFGRGRWKVNDYEPPENTLTTMNAPVTSIENEPVPTSNASAFPTLSAAAPTVLQTDANVPSAGILTVTPVPTAGNLLQQQRPVLGNPSPGVPPPASLLHGYPPSALSNIPPANQPYMLSNHPQYGFYPYFPPPHYPPYAAQWATLAAANHFMNPQPLPTAQQGSSQVPIGNLGDSLRHLEIGSDFNGENPTMPSNIFPNLTNDHLQNAQMAAAAASYMYAAHHQHPGYMTQPPTGAASPYATIPAYHPVPPPATILPPTLSQSLAPVFPTNTTTTTADVQQQQQQAHFASATQQAAPILTSPKHEASSTKSSTPIIVPKPLLTTTAGQTYPTKTFTPATAASNATYADMVKTATTANSGHITDLLSSSPSIMNSQQSLLSPITIQTNTPMSKASTTTLKDLLPYTTSGSPLTLSQTAAASAVAAMGLLDNEIGKSSEITNEILQKLTTPTKQNTTTDIDIKISAAMDLVKMHLLSAVREEVTDLRHQIRTLTERANNAEHENAFLRQHVPSEIYAQYTPLPPPPPPVSSSAVNDLANPNATAMNFSTAVATSIPSSAPPPASLTTSQSIPAASQSSVPSSMPSLQTPLTTPQQQPAPVPASATNLPPL